MFLKQSAATTEGYDHVAVEKRVLRAFRIDGIEEVFPGPGSERAKKMINPKVQIAQLKEGSVARRLEFEKQKFVAELQEQIRINNLEMVKLQAEVLKIISDIQTDKSNVQISAINAQVAAMKAKNEGLLQTVDRVLKAIELDSQGEENGDAGGKGKPPTDGGAPGLAGPSPDEGAPQGNAAVAG